MIYDEPLYRPPSEAYSLIIQVTIGCSHNKCTFCGMYKSKKFRIRSKSDIFRDMEEMAARYNKVRRIFLADGDALVLKTQDLKDILQKIRELFPYCERVGIYATPGDILRKSPEELKSLKEHSLGIVYLGIESGSDKILKDIDKGADSKDMIKAGRRITDSGIKLSVTLISGLGGKDDWQEHAKESARVINAINPDYLGLLTLLIEPGTRMYDMVKEGTFKLLSTEEVALETQMLIRNLELENCIFRSNHASNYFSLAGTLSHDKGKLLEQLDNVLNNIEDYSGEYFRRL
ncbi:MAG: radical SAM protein [Gracilibacteraceae bacterium]|nr:radical SAM protein [Gracilibacteraceae bacterium]